MGWPGSRFRFSVLFVAEVVACAAIGFAAARAAANVGAYYVVFVSPTEKALRLVYLTFFQGFGRAMGALVLIERWRGKGTPWGIGRWMLAYLALGTPLSVLMQMREVDGFSSGVWSFDASAWLDWLTFVGERDVAPLAVAWAIWPMVGRRGERPACVRDAREWAGRLVGAALLAGFVAIVGLGMIGD